MNVKDVRGRVAIGFPPCDLLCAAIRDEPQLREDERFPTADSCIDRNRIISDVVYCSEADATFERTVRVRGKFGRSACSTEIYNISGFLPPSLSPICE